MSKALENALGILMSCKPTWPRATMSWYLLSKGRVVVVLGIRRVAEAGRSGAVRRLGQGAGGRTEHG